ncbi:MAG: hypothetical protein PF572_06370 [Patescibacteria group bacterium]|jgi:outer membrane protein OmpA-like peptidoglycan-associated protein|nr:hypothetical protein [Patescibacteria group bacterium]
MKTLRTITVLFIVLFLLVPINCFATMPGPGPGPGTATLTETSSEATGTATITYSPTTSNYSTSVDKRFLSWVNTSIGFIHPPGYGSDVKGWKTFYKPYLQNISADMLSSVSNITTRRFFTSTNYFPMVFARLPDNNDPVETISEFPTENENENKLLGILTYYGTPDEPLENIVVRLTKKAKEETMLGRMLIQSKYRGYGEVGGISLPATGGISKVLGPSGSKDDKMGSIVVGPVLGKSHAESLDRSIVKMFCYPPDLTVEEKVELAKSKPAELEVQEPFFPAGMQAVMFDFDDSRIKESEFGKIQDIANFIKDAWYKLGPNERILLIGSCDQVGEIAYNDALGGSRAENVFWAATDPILTGMPREKLYGKVAHVSGGNRKLYFPKDDLNRRVDIGVVNIGTLANSTLLPPTE